MSGLGRLVRSGLAALCAVLLAGCIARYDFEIANEGSRDIQNAVLASADKTVAIGDIPRGAETSAVYSHFGEHDTDVYLEFDRGGRRESFFVGNFTAYLFWVEFHDAPIMVRDGNAVWLSDGKDWVLPRRRDLPNPDGSPRR